MPAGIVKSAREAVLAAHHQKRLVTHLEGAEGARCINVTRTADVDPVPIPDLGHFPLVVRRIKIKRRGKTVDGGRQAGITGVASDGRMVRTHRSLLRAQNRAGVVRSGSMTYLNLLRNTTGSFGIAALRGGRAGRELPGKTADGRIGH